MIGQRTLPYSANSEFLRKIWRLAQTNTRSYDWLERFSLLDEAVADLAYGVRMSCRHSPLTSMKLFFPFIRLALFADTQ